MKKKEKIFLEAHNINNLHSGFGQFNYWLIKHLVQHNDEFQFVANARNPKYLKEFRPDVKFQKYYSFNRYPFFRLRKKYSLWHSLNQNSKIEPFYNMPYLLTMHDVIFMEKDRIEDVSTKKIALLKEKIERADHIVYISEHAKKSTNHFFDIPSDKAQSIIYNGNPVIAREPISKKEVDYAPEKPFLFCIGQFLEMKNYHSLVGMMALLPDHELILAGNNEKPYAEVVKKEIEKFGMQDRVRITGRISESQKHFYLQNCEAFVFPSLFEGFGMPPIEAMAYGKPLFLANRTSLPEIGGDKAFYWDEFDPDYMKSIFEKGMNTFENNNNLYQQELKKRAAGFNWDKTAKEYLSVYKTLL